MGVRKDRGRWLADWYDYAGRRRRRWLPSEEEAHRVYANGVAARKMGTPMGAAEITLAEYSQQWIPLMRQAVKPRTAKSYDDNLRIHIIPNLGGYRLQRLGPGPIRALLAEKFGAGLARDSVRLIHATLRTVLATALEDGIILSNPAARLGRFFRLASRPARAANVKALAGEQLRAFFLAAQATPSYRALFQVMAATGIRSGEARALRWEDVDLVKGEIQIRRTAANGGEGTPKGGRERRVELGDAAREILSEHRHAMNVERMARGWAGPLVHVFPSRSGRQLTQTGVSRAFKRVLRAAGLPPHFSPHALRHSYATLLLQAGTSPAYVQQQLGHSGIGLTVDTYGSHLPMSDRAAAGRLDWILREPLGTPTATPLRSVARASVCKSLRRNGAGGRGRTDGLLITNCHAVDANEHAAILAERRRRPGRKR